MANIYQGIEDLQNQTNQLYDEQMKQQENIINTGTQQAIDEIERNKKKAEEVATKTNKALYTDYQKQINPYGVNAENLAEQGLASSGVSESAKTGYYNTYQNARAEATSNANTIKADFDAQITQARQNGDLQLAQSALQMYQQKIQDLYNNYNLKFQQDQFNYQQGQDKVTQSNWEKEYQQAIQQAQWQQQFNQNQFNYQKDRDKVGDSQWQKEYELAKKNSISSGKRSSGGSSSGSLRINPDVKGSGDKQTMSSDAQNIQNQFEQVLNYARNGNHPSSSTYASDIENKIKDGLAKMYNQGTLSDYELTTICNNLKL